jgi:hypothetical protein
MVVRHTVDSDASPERQDALGVFRVDHVGNRSVPSLGRSPAFLTVVRSTPKRYFPNRDVARYRNVRRCRRPARRFATSHAARPRTADRVVEQFECDQISGREVVDRRSCVHVAAMEKHLEMARGADEAAALPNEQFHDSPGLRCPARFRWPGGFPALLLVRRVMAIKMRAIHDASAALKLATAIASLSNDCRTVVSDVITSSGRVRRVGLSRFNGPSTVSWQRKTRPSFPGLRYRRRTRRPG